LRTPFKGAPLNSPTRIAAAAKFIHSQHKFYQRLPLAQRILSPEPEKTRRFSKSGAFFNVRRWLPMKAADRLSPLLGA